MDGYIHTWGLYIAETNDTMHFEQAHEERLPCREAQTKA